MRIEQKVAVITGVSEGIGDGPRQGVPRAGDENIRRRANSFSPSRRMDMRRPNLVQQQQSRCDAVTERCARVRREFPHSTRQYMPPDRYSRGWRTFYFGPGP